MHAEPIQLFRPDWQPFDGLKDAVFLVDAVNIVVFTNSTFTKTFGKLMIAEPKNLGSLLSSLLAASHPDSRHVLEQVLPTDVLQHEDELRMMPPKETIYEISVRSCRYSKKEPAGRLFCFRDVTVGRIRLEQLARECSILMKLNDKSELVVSGLSERLKSNAEGTNRSAQKTVKSLLSLLQEMMRQSYDVTMFGERAQKKIQQIHQILAEGIHDIPGFIADNEKKQDSLHHTFRKLKDDMKELQHGMLDKTGLDEKEIRMIRMIASLMTNKDIAKTLNYEEETIKNKITIIRRKLKLKDRCHLVSYAYQNGLV